MNANPDTSTSGPARLILREADFHEARLWSRARWNLTLLYSGRPGCCASSQGMGGSEGENGGSPEVVERPALWSPRAGCPAG